MGINVHIQRPADDDPNFWIDHPTWDSFRYAGDREVSTIINNNGGKTYPPPQTDHDYTVFRPADLDKLAQAEWPEYNPERWKQLIEILRDPQWWVYISY